MAAGPEGATDRESAERLSEDLIAMLDIWTVGQIRVEAGGRGGKERAIGRGFGDTTAQDQIEIRRAAWLTGISAVGRRSMQASVQRASRCSQASVQ